MFWLGLTVALCYVPGYTGAFIASQWPLLAIVLPFMLFRPGPFTAFHAAGIAFLIYACVSSAWSPVQYASIFGLWLLVLMGLSLWFGTTLGHEDKRTLFKGLAAGAAVSSGLAMLQHFGWHPVAVASALPAGIYVNSVQQGAVLALIVVALVTERLWLWVLPLMPGLYLTGSRGAWLMLAVGLVAQVIRRTWLLGAVAIGLAFYLVLKVSPSDHERLLIWASAWHNLTWFGWGPGTFYTVWLPEVGVFPEHAHNDALQLVFEYGIGAIAPLAIFAFALWCTDAREWPIVVAFATASLYSMPLWMPVASFLGLVCVGRILRVHGVALRDCGHFGRHVLSWRSSHGEPSSETVSVASHH